MFKYVTQVGLDNIPEARAIRQTVFIDEQGFSYEYDDTDPVAHHIVVYDEGGEAVATGRAFPTEGNEREWHIGRVAVLQSQRGTGAGRFVMETLERVAKYNGATEIVLSAQTHALEFYRKLGYAPYGEEYFEEHCPHQSMRKNL